ISQPTSAFVLPSTSAAVSRDLASSPTRRSSDLPPMPRLSASHAQSRFKLLLQILVRFPAGRREHRHAVRRKPCMGLWIAAEALRSEEHTSELQSRENLVCRLLLEKRKRR